ncbi:hypothetical protein D6853_13670 [Butyrivibrio sp. X503]|uniref:hypothetical protein n=1 Tax=Butyrivibrio sp. X503 TaxID=2364878 RepID=UPI000EA95DC2|nr:hypothetical protein [Butyrivibrio sp. X503]RKM54272.1 hypothetical protein D6853_13670 [Butyrivibrio sp. X503]
MGYGSYSASDWKKLKQSRNLSQGQNVEEVFKRRSCDPKFDPKFIGTRECFDSADHPNTTPIVVGLDVTASMGYVAVEVATNALNELITKLYSTGAVDDPALMCAAYGDYQDASPLQVTQFESDIRIAQQLLEIYFESRGNGDVVPTCLWEFLSRHTNIDAVNKRNKKGFVFTIGDNATIRIDSVDDTIGRVIGDNTSYGGRKAVLEELQKSFYAFHIMIGPRNPKNDDLLPGHTIYIDRSEIGQIPEIIISTIQMQNGKGLDEVLKQWDELEVPSIRKALEQISLSDSGMQL